MVAMGTFTGKTVLITGASEGIGRALALALAAERAQLALNARDEVRLAEAVRECAARGAEALALPADVSRQEDCAAMVARAVARFGRLDVLINNAGVTMWSRFDALSDLSVFTRLLATNYLGAVYATAAALPALKAAGGLIVAVASVAGLTGVPERSGYAASKHAMVGFFESLRIELTGSGVLDCPAAIVHGWRDEVVPYEHSVRFAHAYRCALHLVEGDHRLQNQVRVIQYLFEYFLIAHDLPAVAFE